MRNCLFLLMIMFAVTSMAQNVRTHTVQRGETLSQIAQKYGVTEDAIRKANPNLGNMFYTGIKLTIPETPTQTVKESKIQQLPTTNNVFQQNEQPVFTHTKPQNIPQPDKKDNYKRSSLCLMLLTHNGDEYAKAIEEQFLAMPLPNRYNGLNVDLRVINTPVGKASDTYIERILNERGTAKELVSKWFNRDYSGKMNMNRVHLWGGYNATYADLQRARANVRGTALLTDEGSELIKNTFVMVCDISYYDRSNTGSFLSELFAGAASYFNLDAQQRFSQGKDASLSSSLAQLSAASSVASEDIAGFSVKVNAHLLRLKWDKKLLEKMYNEYWVDEETSEYEARNRKAAFDNDRNSFTLEYLGSYLSRSGMTVSKSSNNLDLVIREVCGEAVDRSMNNLAKMFPVFKPTTLYRCVSDNSMYAYIGTKEGVNMKSRFEVLRPEKNKKGILDYKKIAEVKPVNIWNNAGMYITEDNLEQKHHGTLFTRTSGSKELCMPGYLLREKGRLGYQYNKRHTFNAGIILGTTKVSDSKMDKVITDKNSRSIYKGRHFNGECSAFVYGFELGWIYNAHTNFAWNIINGGMVLGTSGKGTEEEGIMEIFATTGAILRTNPLGRNGKYAIFVWPSVGIGYNSLDVAYNTSGNYREKAVWYGTELSWSVKAGLTLSERMYLAFRTSNYTMGGTFGINL